MSDITPDRGRPEDAEPQGPATRALVLGPVTRGRAAAGDNARDAEARVAEAVGLARAIELDVVDGIAVPLAA